jgi:dephospho-CoA kinase
MTKIVGITGGIGTGKTTFSNHLKKLGFLVTSQTGLFLKFTQNQKNNFLVLLKKKSHETL